MENKYTMSEITDFINGVTAKMGQRPGEEALNDAMNTAMDAIKAFGGEDAVKLAEAMALAKMKIIQEYEKAKGKIDDAEAELEEEEACDCPGCSNEDMSENMDEILSQILEDLSKKLNK